MAERKFWQQTPEGKKKISKMMKERWARKQSIKVVPSNRPTDTSSNLLIQFDNLHKDADKRLNEIEKEIKQLQDEKAALEHAFKNDYHRQNEE